MSTIEELNAQIQKKSNEIDAQKEELRKICRQRDRLAKFAAVTEALGNLDDAARKEIILEASGIASAEAVGEPGK